jgi:hypothetical protein
MTFDTRLILQSLQIIANAECLSVMVDLPLDECSNTRLLGDDSEVSCRSSESIQHPVEEILSSPFAMK